ncbi:MAG: hypothetical protein IPK72_22305 [Candidatus Eisenbacteria bacterium]|nr:hypothetical protein [Candidatus Eisenbacteria bacterium]
MTGESGVDSYFASADSIWFQFHGDASADNLTFRAEAVDWVTVTANATGLVLGVAVGDTIGRNFDVELTGDVPDRTVLPFTATAKQNGTVYTHGELAFEVHAPALDLWVLDDVATTASGCGVGPVVLPDRAGRLRECDRERQPGRLRPSRSGPGCSPGRLDRGLCRR